MPSISTALRTSKAQAVANAFNGGSATLTIYSGGQPAVDAAATGTTLVTITLPTTCFNTAASNAITKAGTWSGTVTTGGTAGYFRLVKGSNVLQGSVNTTGAEMNFDSIAFTQNGVVTINTFSYTVP
jgi:hypothetical protein